jgi:hypothetical protein
VTHVLHACCGDRHFVVLCRRQLKRGRACKLHLGTRKTLKLYSNVSWIGDLQKPLPKDFKPKDTTLANYYLSACGTKRFVSGGKGLKASQAYPPLFGKAVAKLFMNNKLKPRPSIKMQIGCTGPCKLAFVDSPDSHWDVVVGIHVNHLPCEATSSWPGAAYTSISRDATPHPSLSSHPFVAEPWGVSPSPECPPPRL